MEKLAICCALLVDIPAISAYAAHGSEIIFFRTL